MSGSCPTQFVDSTAWQNERGTWASNEVKSLSTVPVQQRASARLRCRRRRPMTKRQDRDAIYVKRQFDTEIIVLCVRWYISYRLSYPSA